jgi:hypothetical protein
LDCSRIAGLDVDTYRWLAHPLPMGSGGSIRLIAGVALVIAALALLGLTLPHDPDPGQGWTLYPSYWTGR